jgi:hypothetical protein
MNSNIHEAILAVMKEVGYVQKEANPALRYSYATEAALIRALRPAMVKHGIYCYVLDLPSMAQDAFTTKQGTVMNRTITHGVVRFVHAPTDTHIEVHASGEGMDTGDKSANKAATGLLKYALRQTFLIETGDDPDETPSEIQERTPKPKEVKQTASKPTPKKPAKKTTTKQDSATDFWKFVGHIGLEKTAVHLHINAGDMNEMRAMIGEWAKNEVGNFADALIYLQEREAEIAQEESS